MKILVTGSERYLGSLSELSNDPLGQLALKITDEINHQGLIRLARMPKQAGVKRFIYTSSCTVYGVSGGDFVSDVGILYDFRSGLAQILETTSSY